MYDTIFNLALRVNAMALYGRNVEIGLEAHLLALFIGVGVHFTPNTMRRSLVVAVARRDPVLWRINAHRGGNDSIGRQDRRSAETRR